jgi:O-antigen/teichoic acid export membrane protein
MSRTNKVLALSSAQFVMTIVSVVSSMVFARYLSVADYGTYLQTFLAYDIAVPLLTFGIPSAVYYFLPGSSRPKTLVLETLIILLVAGSIFSLFLILGGTELLSKRFDNIDLNKTLKWMTFYPIYTFPVMIISSVLVINNKTNVNAIYNVVTGIALTLCIIIAAIITKSYEFPLLTRILLPVLFFPIAIHLCFKYIPGKINKPSLRSINKIIKFAIPLGLATVLEGLSLQIANIIVSAMCSPEEFAIYANGAKEIPLIGIISSSISVVIMAEMSEKCKQNKKEESLVLFKNAATMGAYFLIPIMCFLMFYAKEFIEILYTSKYEKSVIPFRIYLLLLPIRIIFYGAIFIALGQSKRLMYRSLVTLPLTTVLCYLLISIGGMNWAALAIVIVQYLWIIPYNWHMLNKEFNCGFFNILPLKKIGLIFILSILIAILSSFFLLFESLPLLVQFINGGLFFSILTLLSFYKIFPEFAELIKSKLKKY